MDMRCRCWAAFTCPDVAGTLVRFSCRVTATHTSCCSCGSIQGRGKTPPPACTRDKRQGTRLTALGPGGAAVDSELKCGSVPFSRLPNIFFSLSKMTGSRRAQRRRRRVFVANRLRVAFVRRSELNGSIRITHCASHVTRHASHVTRHASQMALGRWLLRTLTACTGGVAGGA